MKKLNWGHGIFIAITVMMLSFLTLVYKTTHEKIELVTDDYYPKELKYEEEIQKKKLTHLLTEQITVELTDSVIIQFPNEFKNPELVKGEVWFYKASNMNDDFKDSIQLGQSNRLTYPLTKLANGKYDVIIDWNYNTGNYYYKTSIFIEKD